MTVITLVWAVSRSLATTYEIISYFLLLLLLRCFSSEGLLHSIAGMVLYLQYSGLSHSEILGLNRICQYPKLIAAYHVLHRL